MWGQDDIVEFTQWRDELIVVRARLYWEHVNRSAQQFAAAYSISQRIDIDHSTARCIQKNGTFFHLLELFWAHHPLSGRRFWHVQGYNVSQVKQFVQRTNLLGITDW